MFNFSGKGNTGMFGGGQNYVPPQKEVGANLTLQDVTRINPDDGERYGVEYWFKYAQTLKNAVPGIIEEKDTALRVAAERRAIDAGLRAVIRELLKDLRVKDPSNKLLDKKFRDQIFAEFEKLELDKILKNNNMDMWDPRERPNENQTE